MNENDKEVVLTGKAKLETSKIDIFKDLLKDEDIYNLASAIRGNDYDYRNIKYLFTSRIRFLLGLDDSYGSIRSLYSLSIPHVISILRDVGNARERHMESHYFDHVVSALDVLLDNEMIDRDEYTILTTLVVEMVKYIFHNSDSTDSIAKLLRELTG